MTTKPRLVWMVFLWALIATFAVVSWQRSSRAHEHVIIRREPVGVMGTSCQIVAVVPEADASRGDRILDAAEAELRRAEALFSTWIEASEMSRLNSAPVGVAMKLSPEVASLLDWSQEMYRRTKGAFDITAGPLVETWRRGAKRGEPPSPVELQTARRSSSWDDFQIFTVTPAGLRRRETATLDVDGIAKGYGIDLAIDALMQAGAVGGMIEVGGDLRAVGVPPNGSTWPVGILDPFGDGLLGTIKLEAGAVCTSGSYARPVEIGGRSFSHIIDPRSGAAVTGTASVTVVAGDAAKADAWATALSVLGPAGLELLSDDPDVSAALVLETAEAPEILVSSSFPELKARRQVQIQRLP